MVGEVYTVAGGKGGVGKTTTTVNTSVALQDAGHDVVIVDADLGMSNLGELLGIDHEPTLHDVLGNEAPVSDALADGPAGVSVLAGSGTLEEFAVADPANLKPVISCLEQSFDVVVVDTGAGLSHETIVPASVSDGVVLVTTPDEVSVRDAKKVGKLADRVDGDLLGAVITRATIETDVQAVGEQLGMDILAAVPDVPETAGDEPIVVNAADTYAAQAYRQLATKLLVHADVDGEETGESTVGV